MQDQMLSRHHLHLLCIHTHGALILTQVEFNRLQTTTFNQPPSAEVSHWVFPAGEINSQLNCFSPAITKPLHDDSFTERLPSPVTDNDSKRAFF